MIKLLPLLLVFFGCAASVSTEQYVGEYEKQKSLDEIIDVLDERGFTLALRD